MGCHFDADSLWKETRPQLWNDSTYKRMNGQNDYAKLFLS